MVLGVVGAGLLVLGIVAAATGLLPLSTLDALAGRTVPVLGFVVAISVVAALAAEAGVFAWISDAAARAGRGRTRLLWALLIAVAVASTVFLSLDTTAVLLTPIVVTLATRIGLPPIPFAMTAIWLANTASLLLPVSNLTNLLAESAPALDGQIYLALALLPAIVAIVVPVAILGVVYRRAFRGRYLIPGPTDCFDRPLRAVAAITVALLVPALVSGIAVWIPATVAAVVLVIAFAIRRPETLRFALLPWQLVLFVCGLFLVVAAAGRLGLTPLLAAASGTGETAPELLRLAAVGGAAANVTDNLPAYLALEPVADSPARLMTLLVAVNAGPLITPWASLATLLWSRQLSGLGVRVSWWRFAGLGLMAAPLTVAAATLAVALTA